MPDRVRFSARGLGPLAGDAGQRRMLEEPVGLEAAPPGRPDDRIVQRVLVVVLGGQRCLAHGSQRRHQDPVLVDVIGPRRRLAHEQALVAEAGCPGRHGLAPQHRAPEAPDASLGLRLQRGGQRPQGVGHLRHEDVSLGRVGDVGAHGLGHLGRREADQGRDGAHHVERPGEPAPDLHQGVGSVPAGEGPAVVVDDRHRRVPVPVRRPARRRAPRRWYGRPRSARVDPAAGPPSGRAWWPDGPPCPRTGAGSRRRRPRR